MPMRRGGGELAAPVDDAVGTVETELAVLARSLEALQRRSAVRRDLDRAGYLVCRTLVEAGDRSIGELADLLGLDATTVTRQVAALEEQGNVVRRTDPGDQRRRIVALTANGRRRTAAMRSRRRDRAAELLADFSVVEQEQLAHLLAKLNRAVQEQHLR